MKILVYVFLLFAIPQMSFAGEGHLQVTQAWARPVILQGRPGAAYLTIHNDTDRGDRLIRVSSPLADRVELHMTRSEGGPARVVMKMIPVKNIPVAAHSVVAVAPGGYHLMLFGLQKKLIPGDDLPLILTFANAGDIAVTAKVGKKAP